MLLQILIKAGKLLSKGYINMPNLKLKPNIKIYGIILAFNK